MSTDKQLSDADIDAIYAKHFSGFVTLQDQRNAARAVIEADRSQQVDEIDGLKRQIAEWVAANGPGGWIDDLRRKLAQGEPVAWANPIILLPNDPHEAEGWTARVSGTKDDVFSLPLYIAPQLAQPENHDSVRIPIGEDEAAMMVLLGTNWLKAHAPGRLAQPRGEPDEHPYTYASTQATNCAQCGEYKHTPLRVDAMEGYVCLTCIDKRLEVLLDAELAALAAPQAAVPAENSEHQVERDSLPAAALGRPEVECNGLDTPERVRFYEHDFYVLSNFSAFQVRWKDRVFSTSEAAYHYAKFVGQPESEAWGLAMDIYIAPSAHEAFKIAERNKYLRRADWDDVKVGIMREILLAKVDQHEYVRRKLLSTGDRELVEDSWRDDFWGWGPNHDGQNMLGKLWMEIRAELSAPKP